jgi:trimeric autotransporter adhesin
VAADHSLPVYNESTWDDISGQTGLTYQPGALTATTKYRLEQTDTYCGSNPTTVVNTNEVTITIYNQLVAGTAGSDQTLCYGATPAQLSANAPTGGSGSFAYQWQVYNGSTWDDISGQTGLTYQPGALTATTKYRLEQTDTYCGSNPTTVVTTNEVTITIYNQLVAGTAGSDQTLCYGATPAQLSANAPTGGSGSFAYQWQVYNESTWDDISGQTGLTYQPGALTATTKYRLEQTDTYCGSNPTTVVNTNEVTITIYNQLVAGTAGSDQTLCYGATPTQLSANAPTGGSGTFAYQWQVYNGSTWDDISGQTGLTYQPGALTATTKYRLEQTDTYCGSNPTTVVNTNEVIITIYNQLVAGTAGSNQTLCYGATPAQLSANAPTGGSGTFAYQWQVYNGSTWDDISGQTGLTYQPGALTATTKYRLEQTDTYCGSNPTTVVNTNEVTITIYNQLVAGTAGSDQTLCYGATPAQLSANAPTGGSGTFAYQWQVYNGSTWDDISGQTGLTYQPGALTATTKYRLEQTDTYCGSNPTTVVNTNEVIITIYNQLVAGTAGSDQTLCYGATPAQLSANAPTGGSGTFAYQWQVYNGSTWDDISGQTGLTYQPGAMTATTKYRLEQTDTYCGSNPTTVVNTNEVIITIYNQLVAGTAGSDQTLCYGATPAQLSANAPTGGSGTFAYQWQRHTKSTQG